MKTLLSLALLVSTPTLFGMVGPAPANQSSPSYMKYLPNDLHASYLLPYLLEGDDFSTVTLNIAGYLKTLMAEQCSPRFIRTLADTIAARFLTEFESRYPKISTDPAVNMLKFVNNSENLFPAVLACFALCGIPSAIELFVDALKKPGRIRVFTMLTVDEAHNTLLMSAIDNNLDTVAMNYEMLRPLIATFSMNRELALRTLATFNVDNVNDYGETALIKAVKKGDCQAVQILLESNADTRIADITGNTALSYALSSDNMRLQHIFEQHAAKKLNLLTDFGSTLLIDATRTADEETIRMLLNQGADAFVQDIDGKSALDYARGNHRIKTIFAKALKVEVEALFPR